MREKESTFATNFEEGLLNQLAISLFQLHPSTWVFAKVFQYWCEYRGIDLPIQLFYNLFLISRTLKNSIHDQQIISIRKLN